MDLKENLSNFLQQSINESFSTTVNITPQLTESFPNLEESCLIASIGFTGSIEGTFSISLPDSSACKIVSRMINAEIAKVDNDVVDGIAEQINMIAGGVKMKMKETEDDFDISIPTIILGNRMVVLTEFGNTTKISQNYQNDGIIFSVTVVYKKKVDQEQLKKQKEQATLNAINMLKNASSNKT
ncbi:MAG: chemotaxis protein CheX [Candidatus Omnitrophica bacterium]|nr:chemotaxis protein CheX [Candidatus Omnitrophota bacterium]